MPVKTKMRERKGARRVPRGESGRRIVGTRKGKASRKPMAKRGSRKTAARGSSPRGRVHGARKTTGRGRTRSVSRRSK